MHSGTETLTAWSPTTDADRERVQYEVEAIVASRPFRTSKRYPAMLRYVVSKALQGHSHELKERTLGVEVFDRRPDYDTNTDPVVRFTAGEVRKRLAQYYQEQDRAREGSGLLIELPVGSYVPEFTLRLEAAHGAQEVEPAHPAAAMPAPVPRPETRVEPAMHAAGIADGAASAPGPAMSHAWRPLLAFRWPAVLLLAACLPAALWLSHGRPRADGTEALLRTFYSSAGPVMMVVGTHSLQLTAPEPPETRLYDHMVGPYHHVSISIAIALARLAAVLKMHNVTDVVKEAPTTTLTDLRERSIMLVGALNNEWTLRLTEPLRFRFAQGPLARIEDREHPEQRSWQVNFDAPFSNVATDYAIVAHFHDVTTNGNVLVVGGLGPYGTEAASELIATPQYLDQIGKELPAGWQGRNVELVLRTDVLDGQAGPPTLVGWTVW